MSGARTKRVGAYLSTQEQMKFQHWAAKQGLTVSAALRMLALQASEEKNEQLAS